jgi:hypothetical protein
MSTFLAVALSLSLGLPWDGPNGLAPGDLWLAADLVRGGFDADLTESAAWIAWFEKDPTRRSEVMKYFVRCALDEGTVVRHGSHAWEGRFGLAGSRVAALERAAAEAALAAEEAAKRGEKGGAKDVPATQPVRMELPRAEGQWVSSCLMAHVNVAGRHEYVSLRGNPPGAAGKRLVPSAASRWTMGYPEGVFAADLFSAPSPDPNAPLERSFTVSLNLPEKYPTDKPAWWPPNERLGRGLTYRPETEAPNSPGQGAHRIAARLGTFEALKSRLGAAPARTDPHYAFTVLEHPDGPLPALVVHLPRLVNLEAFERASRPDALMQAVDVGPDPVEPGQIERCPSPDRCLGPFPLVREGEIPLPPASPAPPARLAGLRDGQELMPVLRLPPTEQRVAPGERFTAIVRYWGTGDTRARVEVLDEDGEWRCLGDVWPDSSGRWLQVYPVLARGGDDDTKGVVSLRLRIVGEGDGKSAPRLDAAGFVPGPPWCHRCDAPFMGVCPDAERRAPSPFDASPGQRGACVR